MIILNIGLTNKTWLTDSKCSIFFYSFNLEFWLVQFDLIQLDNQIEHANNVKYNSINRWFENDYDRICSVSFDCQHHSTKEEKKIKLKCKLVRDWVKKIHCKMLPFTNICICSFLSG